MKLKPLFVNGYKILINDEKTQVELNKVYYEADNKAIICVKETLLICPLNEIIYADPELMLNVPAVPDWEQWVDEQLAKEYTKSLGYTNTSMDDRRLWSRLQRGFIAGRQTDFKFTAYQVHKILGEMAAECLCDNGKVRTPAQASKWAYDRIQAELLPRYIHVNDLNEITEVIW